MQYFVLSHSLEVKSDMGRSLACMGKILAMSTASALNIVAIDGVIDQSQVDVMIFRFTTNTQPSCCNAGEDNSNEFSERGRIERLHAFCCTTIGILRVNTVPGD